jgi:hypothetical protein
MELESKWKRDMKNVQKGYKGGDEKALNVNDKPKWNKNLKNNFKGERRCSQMGIHRNRPLDGERVSTRRILDTCNGY